MEKEEGDWGRGSPFPFRAFLPLPLTGLFAQYSFTVHNKVVVYLVFLRKLTRSFAEKFFLYVMPF